ncbi:MAG TPA: transglycosylase SLT domain-containing protein, partial [Burkholderiaceae bacterium]|nr:transglycosylase SLT domain-containing protein [Burkholderiaceae bacterium]
MNTTDNSPRLSLLTAIPFVFALTLAACSTVEQGPATAADGAPVVAAAASQPADAASAPAAAASDASAVVAASAAASAPAAAASDAEAMEADDEDDTDAAKTGPAPAVLPPYDPLQPDTKVDLDDSAARADLWHRVRAGFAIPDMDTPAVKQWEQWYASRPDYVARMTARGSRYLYHITQEVERRHMPTELALLPFTESAFNPQAMSVARASGMWQFVSATGKDFELKQNIFRDDRRDVLASTRAALDYLQRLHDMFGDWQLALAAYNCGQGNVQRAINRNLKHGLPTDYASLSLPKETSEYVPKLQAVKNIVLHPEAYSLTLPPVGNHPYFLSVPIERDIDVDTAAKLAKVPLDEFRMLNPQLDKPVILAAGTPQVLLPYDNADDFVHAVKAHQGPLATWTVYRVGKTMRPADAAKVVGMSETELREVNRIPARMLVRS